MNVTWTLYPVCVVIPVRIFFWTSADEERHWFAVEPGRSKRDGERSLRGSAAALRNCANRPRDPFRIRRGRDLLTRGARDVRPLERIFLRSATATRTGGSRSRRRGRCARAHVCIIRADCYPRNLG